MLASINLSQLSQPINLFFNLPHKKQFHASKLTIPPYTKVIDRLSIRHWPHLDVLIHGRNVQQDLYSYILSYKPVQLT